MSYSLSLLFERNELLEVPLRALVKEGFNDLFLAASDPLIWEQHQNKNRYTLNGFAEFFNELLNSKDALTIIDKCRAYLNCFNKNSHF